jgi:hypothetical protein
MLQFRNVLVRLRPYAFFVLFFVLFALPVLTVFAAPDVSGSGAHDVSGSGSGLYNPLQSNTLQDLLGKVLDGVIAIGTVVVTIMLVYCGFLFVVAQGAEEKIREARTALMWTVIGALVLLGAKVISGVISNTVGTL